MQFNQSSFEINGYSLGLYHYKRYELYRIIDIIKVHPKTFMLHLFAALHLHKVHYALDMQQRASFAYQNEAIAGLLFLYNNNLLFRYAVETVV